MTADFNPVEELLSIVKDIEGKLPTDLLDYFDEKEAYLRSQGITEDTYVGDNPVGKWNKKNTSEYLLGQFVGIVMKGRESKAFYGTFGLWLKHVYHFIIDNVPQIPDFPEEE